MLELYYGGDEASMGKKRNKKGTKKVVQESQPPEDTPLGNDAKAEKNCCLGNVVPASDQPLEVYLPKP